MKPPNLDPRPNWYKRLQEAADTATQGLLERQKVGIAKAKQEGKYKGRVPTARRMEKDIQSLHLKGMKPSQIAKELNIGVASVYRYR